MTEGSDCPSGKVQFADRKAAGGVVRSLRARDGHGHRVYRCEMCGCLHVASSRRSVKKQRVAGR